jgi:hypothetical protein
LFGSGDVGLVEVSQVTPFGMDVTVESDVLAAAGGVDVSVMSGEGAKTITSPRVGAFQVATRMPTALQSGMVEQGDIKQLTDSILYSYAPATANTHFIQLGIDSINGGPMAMLLPKSGKRADMLGSFNRRFGVDTKSTDPLYVLVSDGYLGYPVPYDVALVVEDTPCTAMTETAGNIDPTTANAIAMLPALVSGDLFEGMSQSDDWFKFDVTGASMASPKSIHMATGGDGLSDVIAEVFDTDMFSPLGYTDPDATHKNLIISDITVDGTYYVRVTTGFGFDASHSAYKLLVEVQ